MGALGNLLAAIGNFLRGGIALLVPFLAQARDVRSWSPALRWAVRLVLLILLFLGLWWVNRFFALDRWLKAPVLRGMGLHQFWLPILGLLTVALLWVVWWIWHLLGPEVESTDFPDIDEAWDEAVRALHQAGIDLTEVPLFLLLGKTLGGDEALAQASQLPLMVKLAPARADAPLHVFGNRDAVFVTCAGASLLGQHAVNLTGQGGIATAAGAPVAPSGDGEEEDPFKTMRPKGRSKEVGQILARAREEGRNPSELNEEEQEKIRHLLEAEEGEAGERPARPKPNLLRNPEQTAWLSARLRHLCRLILRDRHPYCPVNGTLVLVPYAALDGDEEANQTASICQQDLSGARQVFQVHCPLFVLVCDLETAPGFREFLSRFSAEERQRRVGQRFPLMPDLGENESAADLIDRGVQWICTALLPTWLYKSFRIETPGREDRPAVIRANTGLYRLLYQIRERRKRLGRVVSRAATFDTSGPLLYGGCYLSGTGRDSAREQAFVAGVFQRLIREQSAVQWTEEGTREEADYERWTRYGYAGLAIAAMGLVALGYLAWTGM